jgi:hypothetical protein
MWFTIIVFYTFCIFFKIKANSNIVMNTLKSNSRPLVSSLSSQITDLDA